MVDPRGPVDAAKPFESDFRDSPHLLDSEEDLREAPAAAPGSGGLGRRSARTLYNVADALVPPGPDEAPGGGDVDLLPFFARRLRSRGPGAARRLRALLACIEWQPLVGLHSYRGFSRLPRDRRRALLERWERSRLPARRRALAGLRAWVQQGLAGHSSEGA